MASFTVIGGGPAGAIAALRLARWGQTVQILEQHRFPRDKVCGECLSALGMQTLRRLGLAEHVMSAGAVALTHVGLYPSSGNGLVLPLPAPMWGISRYVLDNLLLDQAVAAGVRLLQPWRCEGINGAVTARDLAHNRIQQIYSDWILLADGKGLAGRRSLTGDLGVKAHFAAVNGSRNTIALFGARGHYIGLAPIEGRRWNMAYSVPARRVRAHGGNLDALWRTVLRENHHLTRHMAGACRIGPWLAAPLPRFAIDGDWPIGVIPIGNAAAAIEPIGGEGMGLAMRSALIAADCLAGPQALSPTLAAAEILSHFRSMWRTRAISCRAVAVLMSSPLLSRCAIGAARALPGLDDLFMRLIGKSRLTAQCPC